ncbi:related to Cell wall synthesis protein KRE9 [Saccharomycodes ludwigii]|uniref:Related to Cell wall synthesis protein KRE9 n=1 Tax=Saccharomycodes ludwigii TaxID=36035 RepID=A0A376BAP5_9ASCO|nr:hypothetical protein SCDLUD_003954 [Saccharomycodes ludwigii]KAH3899671.1 hypothetical protein SCDLUD_003954 [Saccharomycodes ludwigii]SSD61732.1 related to Cell wall synthesis protein KRE9 [Saccharomycodes ludwigii]
MIFLINFILFLQTLVTLTKADIDIVSPKADAVFTATSTSSTVTIELEWIDDGSYPNIDKITSISLLLCTGANTKINCFKTLANAIPISDVTVDSDESTYTVEIDASVSGNGQYYLQVFALYDGIGYTIHYSPRFELSGMSGTVTSYTYSDSTQPAAQYYITSESSASTTQTESIDTSASFTVPYTLQTGHTRFAPMQMQPSSKVTATTWTRRFPTSKVTFYSSFNMKGTYYMSTITPGWSYTITSDVNYATPASFPIDNGGWYDPTKKLSLTPRKLNLQNLLSSTKGNGTTSNTSS